ncbi:Glycosyltransferase involved in cell wall bisynthesis [Rhizobiales bacterium GAS191]|jgi:glycosyltransferase involved in cell wall biosynthesis|nr:Glycosyltransferase involved in cell wall bisynthesis [Rhizobiales bacterium GAS113]SEE43629.1 Glycosyltransferase involved in cell wall bisynthesis [Rhizobiales bacterium GAS191]
MPFPTSDTIAARDNGAGRPRVSVIVIFLNVEAFLVEAIESVLAQTYEDWELLLVDDGSSDASTAITKDYAAQHPGKIRYLEHAGHGNRGMSASRNLGIGQARGEFLAFIDADDVWLPTKLADQLAIMDASPDLAMVCGAVLYWRSWSGGEDQVFPTGHVFDHMVFPPEAAIELYPLGSSISACPSDILVRKSAAERVGCFEEHFTGSRQMYEDQGFFVKLFLAAPVYFSTQIWLKYRQHPGSISAVVNNAGRYSEVRSYFLNWLESYLADRPETDQRVNDALSRALRPYRRPRTHHVLARLHRARQRCRVAIDRFIR